MLVVFLWRDVFETMSVIAIVKSERGKDHVFLDGFTFRRAYYHSTVGGWKWRCTNKKCSANIYLNDELTILPGSSCEHNHSALSRKRRYVKEMDQMDSTVSLAATSTLPLETCLAEGESQPLTNGDVTISKVPKKEEAVSRSPEKPKRARRANAGVKANAAVKAGAALKANGGVKVKASNGIKANAAVKANTRVRRKPKKVPLQDIPEGTHHLAEDYEFPLDQCDSNTVFVNIFENQTQTAQPASRTSTSNPTTAEEQPENFDPLLETFRTTAFPAICDLSPKEETENGPNEVIDLDNDDDGAEVNVITEEADDECLLYEDVSLRRNMRVYPYHSVESFKNSSSRSLYVQNSRSRMQGSIDLAHHVDTFFFAMAQSVKRLSTVNQIKVKQMITKVITKFEMDEAVYESTRF